jgi:hypothetical protein
MDVKIPVFALKNDSSIALQRKAPRSGEITERIIEMPAALESYEKALKTISDAETHAVKDGKTVWQAIAMVADAHASDLLAGIPKSIKNPDGSERTISAEKRSKLVSTGFRMLLARELQKKLSIDDDKLATWKPATVSPYIAVASRALATGIELMPAEGKVLPYDVARGVRTNVRNAVEVLDGRRDSFRNLLDGVRKLEVAQVKTFVDAVTPAWDQFIADYKEGKVGKNASQTDQSTVVGNEPAKDAPIGEVLAYHQRKALADEMERDRKTAERKAKRAA